MLELHDLVAGYGAVDVVRGVTLNVERGETVALLGPNGAGKSTLMAALTGTVPKRSGQILLDGADMISTDSHRIVGRGMALVPEGRLMFPPMSVRDNLHLGATQLHPQVGGSLADRFDYVFGLFPRLRERSDQAAGTLSGGEQQMLAIGRALMSAPRVLLLDEPFLGLAPMVVQEIRTALSALKSEGLTILLVEQKLDIALMLAERAYVLIKGRVELAAAAETLRQREDLDRLYFALAQAQKE
jgi:branched-chain amino acid transport system ATP-binding protein